MRQCLCGRNEVECLEQTQKYLEKTSSINKYEVNKLTLCRDHKQMKNIEQKTVQSVVRRNLEVILGPLQTPQKW